MEVVIIHYIVMDGHQRITRCTCLYEETGGIFEFVYSIETFFQSSLDRNTLLKTYMVKTGTKYIWCID